MSQPNKRQRILDAAIQVFAQYGFYNAKVSQVARQAGVADGTIYLYFKNKEDILIQVFRESMAEILARQEEALAGLGDPIEKLEAFARTHFIAVSTSRALAEVITVELRQSTKFMRNTDMKPFGRYLGIIARIIEEGQEVGVFAREIHSRMAARAVFGAIDELSLSWAMGKRQTSLEEAASQTTMLFLNGLRLRPDHA